jgi:Cu/Zn superoxide dismutase
MVHHAARFAGFTLGIAFLAAVVGAGSTFAQEEQQGVSVQLTPSRDSGVSGTATLKDVKEGVEVTLQMRNLPEAGIKHINHIHAGGSCADDRAGRTAPVTIPPGIACADLAPSAAKGVSLNEETTMMGERTTMVSDIPSSGGPTILLPTAALLVVAGALGYAVLRRSM